MSKTKNKFGLALALELLEENYCEWGGNAEPEELAAARFAVVVRNDSQSWVVAANDWQMVATIHLDTLTTDSLDAEYVGQVIEMATGEHQQFGYTIAVEIKTRTGETFAADTRPKGTNIAQLVAEFNAQK
jgi:hypothetical protein